MTRSILLTAALAALAVGLVVTTGVRLDRATEEEILTRFSHRQLLLAEQTAAAIQSVFDKAQQYLLHFKDAPGPTRLTDALEAEDEEGIATWRGATGQGFSGCLRSHPNYTQIRYIDAGGQEIVVVDSDGETVRVVPQDELRSQAEREFFIATQQLDEGEIYVSPLEPALGHGEMGAGLLAVRLATPIFDSQGRRAGIIVINLLADEIRAHIARLTIEEGVDAWVLNETGVEIINVAHPELEGSNAYEYCQQTGDETLIALTEDMLAGRRGTGIYLWPESEGGPLVLKKLIAYTPIHLVEGQLWSLGISESYDPILAAHRQTRTMLLFLSGSITLIILITAILAAQSHRKQAVAEEQARLSETLRRRGEELEALQEISLAITAQLELDQLLQNIVERGCRLLNASMGAVYLVDETKDDLQLVISHGYTRDYTGTRLAPGAGLSGKVLQSGKPLAVDDYRHWEGRSPDWEAEPITGILGVPLKRGERVIGVMDFAQIAQASSFDEHDVWLATLFAIHAAVAIENARLYQAEQRGREVAEALQETARVVNASLNLAKVLPLILEQLAQVIQYDSSAVLLLSDDRFKVTAGRGFPDLEAVLRLSYSADEDNLPSAVMSARRPLIIADVQADSHWQPDPAVTHIHGWIGAPLVVRDKVIGILTVDSRRPGAYSEEDGQLVFAFANQVAVAIENARLFQAEQRRTEEIATLAEVGRAVSSTLDLDQVLESIVTHATALSRSDAGGIFELDKAEGVLRITASCNASHEFVKAVNEAGPKIGEGTIGVAVATREPVQLVDTGTGARYRFPEIAVIDGIHSVLAVPMLKGKKSLGGIALWRRKPGPFSPQDVALLTTLADHAAVAVENARLYEQAQQEIAERKRAQEALDQRLIVLTQPVGAVGELTLTDVIDVKILQELQDKFAESYDVASLIFDDAGKPVTQPSNFSDFCKIIRATQKGMERCEISDARLARLVADGSSAVVPCKNFAAIQDGAVPIFVGDRHVATWAIGQKLTDELVEGEVRGYAEEIGLDPDQLVAAAKKLKIGSKEQFERAVSFLETAAGSISLLGLQNIQQAREITERKRAQEALKRRATQLATLSEVGRRITSLLELDPLLDHIVNLICEAFSYYHVSILLIDPSTGELALRAGAGYELQSLKPLSLRVGQDSVCGWVAASGEPLLVSDVSQESRYYPVEALADVRSELAVPVQVKGHVVGVLDVQSTQLEAFDEDDLFTLKMLADQVAVALENAGLYHELRHYAGQLEQRVQERTAQLQAQYARLDAILRSASDGIVVTGAGGEIIQTNPVAQAWLTQTLSPEDAARLQEAVQRLARQAEGRPEMVLELTGLDLELRTAPISGLGMEEAVAVVAVHDVSHLKALDRAKSRFVSNVSHELRTPVTTIKLYAHLVQRTPPGTEKWAEYLDALAQEADRQARLVEDILQISRIDVGRLEIKPRPTPLDELTGVAIASHQVLAQSQGLTLEYRPPPAPPASGVGEGGGGPVAMVDPERMMQVLNNLVRNGIHYAPEGGKVTIATGMEEAEGRVWATVTVADTGMGIPEEELPHVFERFFRGEKPRLMQIPGTGLGLAIVQEIVDLHGGRVTVESQVDVGTTFTVWLPLVED